MTTMQFKKFPVFLFSEYKELSSDAKILYTVLSDRKTLSEKNGWTDENGVYILFPLEEVSEYIPSSKGKASRIMKELRDVGLICRKRMGQGKADRIYVNIPCEAADVGCPQKIKQDFSECSESIPQSSLNETLKLSVPEPNQTEYNNTYISIDQSVKYDRRGEKPVHLKDRTDIIPIRERVDNSLNTVIRNTGLDELPDDPLNEIILDIVREVMDGSNTDTVRINGADKPKSVVRSCFMKLDRRCIEHFIDRLANYTDLKTVRNKRSYMRSMLYNSYFESVFGNPCMGTDAAYGT